MIRALCIISLLSVNLLSAQETKEQAKPGARGLDAAPDKGYPLANLRFRSIGPALLSGRIVGLAVHPQDRSHYFVAVASGGVWKTDNAGVSWKPIFDNEGSYSIGCVVLDPKDPNTVWVGTGENNSQRSVGYGDGVYKSVDGGKSWTNLGLKDSQHIGKIVIDPRNSDTVYVASQGPLWNAGGDRGLYKTTDGGKIWNKILTISDNTGITDLVQDPRNPENMIAAAYQRRRHVYTLVNGGPESALYRTTDGGKTWNKLKSGLPTAEWGRVGLARSPSDPETVYAIVEAADKQGGIFRSNDNGLTWEKRNPFDQQAQYYAHIVVDPKNKERLYVMSVFLQVSDDGGKTLRNLGERWKHVDNHTIWIDPEHPDYYMVGCDGGLYESYDRATSWRHISNLPVTQFYDVTCEQIDSPFYKVYGGTQDNNTLGGPNHSISGHGISNSDWHVIVGGDGFTCRVDPKDPNIVYAESQYGGLVRFDWRTGQRISIVPQAKPNEPPLRWNWDSPIIVSPHKNTRIYFAANRLFRSDDRGDNWTLVSGDLSRQLDRDKLPVMGKIQPPDAVSKHVSTSFFGNITALSESPKKEGLIYVGTDDGLIQVTEDGGKNWRKIEKFPKVPDMTFVARVAASQHDVNTVYAVMENHKNGDFAPYLLKSTDLGNTWTSIVGDLPARGSTLAFVEDHVDPKLLFAGTEFGLYVSKDGGGKWHRLKNGLPTVAVKDLCIQQPMNDLVVATFGRGFYVLDDYSALRTATAEDLNQQAKLFAVRDAGLYMPTLQYGLRGKAFLGEAFYTAENPPYGAIITYHLKDALKTQKKQRQEKEKKDPKAYPSKEELRAEAEEEEPSIVVTITDAKGQPVRVLSGSATAGVHRVTWDLTLPAVNLPRPTPIGEGVEDLFGPPPGGPYAGPGQYRVSIAQRLKGVVTAIGEPVTFNVKYVGPMPLPEEDWKRLTEFQQQVFKLQRDLVAVQGIANELTTRLEQMKHALDLTPNAPADARDRVRKLIAAHRDTVRSLNGDAILRGRNENTPMSLAERVGVASSATRTIVNVPTGTEREQYTIARKGIDEIRQTLRQRLEKDVKELEKLLDNLGAPWTPGRLGGSDQDRDKD